MQLAREQVIGQLAQVLLEQAGDSVRVVVLGALKQVDIAIGIEAIFEHANHVSAAAQAEDAFFVLSVLRGGDVSMSNQRMAPVDAPSLRGIRHSGRRSPAARVRVGCARRRLPP